MLLSEKICLVTGASKGIGKSIVELFVQQGATVYANTRALGTLDELADELNESYRGKAIPLYFDITDSTAIMNAVKQIKKEAGTVDVLVNNAGVVSNELLGMISLEKTKMMFDVNVFGALELSQLIISKFMMRQKSGSVINIASAVGLHGCGGQIAYSSSKGAIISMTKSMAKELAKNNIRVNAIAPGMIGTDRILNTIETQYKGKIPDIGMGRLGKPDEIANTCLYLASELSSYTTGQIIEVSGDIKL